MTAQLVVSPDNSGLTPEQIIQTYSSAEWEKFIAEWAEGFEPPYHQVVRLAGPGDKGRDIVGHCTDPVDRTGEWDSYQCKHYDHALHPTDIYLELAKLCFYTFDGSFTRPRKYRFVGPFGVGTKLYDFLRDPTRLRAELIANWDGYCRRDITGTSEVPLEGALMTHVVNFDFSIVWFLTPAEIIAQHERTKYWHRRFKIDPPVRPGTPDVPTELQTHELPYVKCLLDAYSDHLGRSLADPMALDSEPKLATHFKRSRGYFFSAEALGRFSRDHFEPNAFETLKGHMYDAVIDTVDSKFDDGLARLQGTTELSVSVALPDSELKPYVGPADRKGLCHHLANDGKVRWCSDAK